jgi:hypothetical protein
MIMYFYHPSKYLIEKMIIDVVTWLTFQMDILFSVNETFDIAILKKQNNQIFTRVIKIHDHIQNININLHSLTRLDIYIL